MCNRFAQFDFVINYISLRSGWVGGQPWSEARGVTRSCHKACHKVPISCVTRFRSAVSQGVSQGIGQALTVQGGFRKQPYIYIYIYIFIYTYLFVKHIPVQGIMNKRSHKRPTFLFLYKRSLQQKALLHNRTPRAKIRQVEPTPEQGVAKQKAHKRHTDWFHKYSWRPKIRLDNGKPRAKSPEDEQI